MPTKVTRLEGSRLLGISPSTVDRRIECQELHVELEPMAVATGSGSSWRMKLVKHQLKSQVSAHLEVQVITRMSLT